MKVDVACKKCGQQKRMEIGVPAPGQELADYLRLLHDRLVHRPSFECFGGHFELEPPVPTYWEVRWDTVGE
jgi:predicted nucleic-acid-binding Zn-ribbon protein